MTMKKCYKCNKEKNKDFFYNNKSKKDGLTDECKMCVKEIYAKKYKENKEHIIKRVKKYSSTRKGKKREYDKEYRKKNKEKLKIKINKRLCKRRQTDTLFRIKENIKTLIRNSIVYGKFSKKTKTAKILGCTYEKLKEHLEDNPYNLKYEDADIDLDHIIPISSSKTEEEIYKLNHYTNFQLLPSYYNRNVKADNKWDRDNFEEWLEKNKKECIDEI